jgi:hypothetical protein
MVRAAVYVPWRLIFQVHDEVGYDWTVEGRPSRMQLYELAKVYEEPGDFYGLRVPLVFEPHVVPTWADKGKDVLDPDVVAEMEEVNG